MYPELAKVVDSLAGELFVEAEDAALFELLCQVGTAEPAWTSEAFRDQLDVALCGHVQSLVEQHGRRPSVSREEAREAVDVVARRLWRERLRERDRDLQAMIQAALEEGDTEAVARYAGAVDEVTERLRQIAAEEKARTLAGKRATREW